MSSRNYSAQSTRTLDLGISCLCFAHSFPESDLVFPNRMRRREIPRLAGASKCVLGDRWHYLLFWLWKVSPLLDSGYLSVCLDWISICCSVFFVYLFRFCDSDVFVGLSGLCVSIGAWVATPRVF